MHLADDAVYTILHPKRLAEMAATGQPAQVHESKRWVTAKGLFDEARGRHVEMAILFADAANDCSKLLYSGTLTEMAVGQQGTDYTVTNLTPVARHRTQELVLRSTGKTIAEGYLRPYAVVRTPSFVRESAPVSSGDRAQLAEITMFSFGYWGAGSATRELVDAVNEAEASRGFEPPLWVDIRESRSVRAAGFRDKAFANLLQEQYIWMRDLGNRKFRETKEIAIGRPAAAEDLLDLALQNPKQRVIFFCACPFPNYCHRHTVAQLLRNVAKRCGIEVTTIEWPGGAPRELTIDVPAAVLRNVARDAQATLALPFDMSVGEAASLPWGTQALLKADSEAISVLLGPALFDTRGAHLRILAANPSPSEAAETLRKHAS